MIMVEAKRRGRTYVKHFHAKKGIGKGYSLVKRKAVK